MHIICYDCINQVSKSSFACSTFTELFIISWYCTISSFYLWNVILTRLPITITRNEILTWSRDINGIWLIILQGNLICQSLAARLNPNLSRIVPNKIFLANRTSQKFICNHFNTSISFIFNFIVLIIFSNFDIIISLIINVFFFSSKLIEERHQSSHLL